MGNPRRRVKAAMGGKGARDGGRNGSVSGGSSTVSPTAIAGGVVVAITLLGVGWLTMAPEATTLAEAVQHITRRASGSSRPFDPVGCPYTLVPCTLYPHPLIR